jgi:hypothetical protein
MSNEKKLQFMDQLPRWVLVALALYGVLSLKGLHDQIRTDHDTVTQHGQRITQLEEISARLAELVEQRKTKGQL